MKKKSGYKKLNESQKLSNKYRRQLRKIYGEDFVISDAEMRAFKREMKLQKGFKKQHGEDALF